jgi:gliding motility-associated protein GldC
MKQDKIARTSSIQLKVSLNEKKRPVDIECVSEDGGHAGKPQACKAFLLSLFEKNTQDTLKIDLWTEEMEVREMDRFFFQTLRAMADTYFQATQNRELAEDMQRFTQYFGEKTGILKKST